MIHLQVMLVRIQMVWVDCTRCGFQMYAEPNSEDMYYCDECMSRFSDELIDAIDAMDAPQSRCQVDWKAEGF